jgi:glycosyltransferase involved in cell wall biosynthesis
MRNKRSTENGQRKTVLSVALLASNEEENITKCLDSVKHIADEMVVLVDSRSKDNTEKIAKKYTDKVFKVDYKSNFHINKQKAIDKGTGEWILQLDADERVSKELAKEIKEVIFMSSSQLIAYSEKLATRNPKLAKLFKRHQSLIEKRDSKRTTDHRPRTTDHGPQSTVHDQQPVAFFIPRRNFFLGKPLIHGGVYPDGVIRLIKRGKARLPGKSVHEVMEVDGQVGWLFNDLEHHESPTLERYLERWNRYTDLIAKDFEKQGVPANAIYLIHYSIFKPLFCFLNLYLRHKGALDGMRGFIWSLFSALRFPVSYFKYWHKVKG